MDYAEKMQRFYEYVEALEEERRKILVFRRELPLCLELVTQAIESCKRELSGATTECLHGQSECSEQTSSEGPVLAEFIPIKRTDSSSPSDIGDDDRDHDQDNDDDDDELQSHKRNKSSRSSSIEDRLDKKKSDWLRSVQLWNQSPDSPPNKEEVVPRKAAVTEVNSNNGGAFQPFHKEKSVGDDDNNNNNNNQQAMAIGKAPTSVVPASAASLSAETLAGGGSSGGGGSGGKKEEKEGQNPRKQRRCWSPELHRRFLHALEQLGGSHVATPKQIRELMKVDGLTNDEVKSHLQKYRLHTRRPSPTIHSSSNPQTPQFVVVGGIWVPAAEYAAVAAAAAAASGEPSPVATTNDIYAPVAAPPPQPSTSEVQKPQQTRSENVQCEGRGSSSSNSEEGGGVRSNSPAASSSSDVLIAS